MKKSITILFFFIATLVNAQTDTVNYWTKEGKVSLNANQNYFSNWSAGGESSYGIIGKLTFKADYKKDKNAWTNWFDMALGYSVIGDDDTKKTEDKIEYITSYTRNLSDNILFSVVGSFKSQFAKGYDYSNDTTIYTSKFLAPAYIDLGPGIQYKPNDHFLVNYSPATARILIVNDQELADKGAFGLDPATVDDNGVITEHAKKTKGMFGSKLAFVINYDIAKNVNIASKLELFSDYMDAPQNIDVDWQVLLGMKVNKWLNVDISTQMLYDDDIMITDKNGNTGPRVQFKQLMMVGLSFNF